MFLRKSGLWWKVEFGGGDIYWSAGQLAAGFGMLATCASTSYCIFLYVVHSPRSMSYKGFHHFGAR